MSPMRDASVLIAAALVATFATASRLDAQAAAVQSATVSGVVTDQATGAPLAGAHLRLVQLERGAETHSDGRFVLPNIPPGTYTLVAQRIGYRPATLPVTVTGSEPVTVAVRLESSPISLAPLVATGALEARAADQALQPTTIVAGRDLDRRLGTTIGETLEHEPGIASVSMGPATARPIIRGLGGDRVVLLEDGARSGDMSYSSSDHAVTADPLSVERIEVVRGPAALLYGSNALSGVVNVIREEIPATRSEGVHGRAGVQLQSASPGGTFGGHVTAPLGALALRAEGSFREAGDLRTPDGPLENTQLRNFGGAVGLGLVRDWGHAGASYRYFNSSYGIPGGFVGAHAAGVNVDMRRNSFRAELHRHVGAPLSDVEVGGGFVHYAHEEIERGGILGTAFRLITAHGNAIARHEELGPFSSGGVGVRVQYRDYAFGGSLETPDAREVSGAAFFLEELETSRVRFQFGGRYDVTRIEPVAPPASSEIGDIRPRTFGALSGSVGGLLDLGDGVGFGVNVGRAFRTPDVNELYSEGPHLAAYREEIGNPDLDVETGLGVDAFVRLTRTGIRAELAAFHNRITNFIYPRETGDTSQRDLPIAQYVGQDAELIGMEGRLEASPLAYVAVTVVASYVRGTLTESGQPLPLVPPLRGSIGVRYERPAYFIGLGVRFSDRQDRLGEFETPTPGYGVLHGTAGYAWQWFGRLHSVTLSVDNLADHLYREHLSRVKSIMPEAGRNVSLLYRVDL